MRVLSGIFSFVALIMFAGVATAKIDECQPDGMLDIEAARIIAIAAEQGKAFRATIDAMRASGMNFYTDTTYDDLMADPERAIALAKERYEGWEKSPNGRSPEERLKIGAGHGRALKHSINHWVIKQNVNFFTTELTGHMQQLAIQLGGVPTESPFRYVIDANTFVFALNHFIKGADLKYLYGRSPSRELLKTHNIPYMTSSYSLSEEWGPIRVKPNFKFPIILNFIPSRKDSLNGWKSSFKFPVSRNIFSLWKIRLNRRKPSFSIRISLTSNLKGENITLSQVFFGESDLLKNRWLAFESPIEGCLATFPQIDD